MPEENDAGEEVRECHHHYHPKKHHLQSEMEKRADNADISVLFFGGCANFLAVYAQTN